MTIIGLNLFIANNWNTIMCRRKMSN